jgi:hypothetical protein
MRKIKVKYRRATFTVMADKPLECDVCGAKGKIDCHHIAYVYKTKEVRKDTQKALENTMWLCFHCHILADCLRQLENDSIRTFMVKKKIEELKDNEEQNNHSKLRSLEKADGNQSQ